MCTRTRGSQFDHFQLMAVEEYLFIYLLMHISISLFISFNSLFYFIIRFFFNIIFAASSAVRAIRSNNLCFSLRSSIDSFSRLGRSLWYVNATRVQKKKFSWDHINAVHTELQLVLNIHTGPSALLFSVQFIYLFIYLFDGARGFSACVWSTLTPLTHTITHTHTCRHIRVFRGLSKHNRNTRVPALLGQGTTCTGVCVRL